MFKLLIVIGVLLIGICLILAYSYLIIVSRENEMPDFEDVEMIHEKK